MDKLHYKSVLELRDLFEHGEMLPVHVGTHPFMNKQNALSIVCAFVVVLGVSGVLFAHPSMAPD